MEGILSNRRPTARAFALAAALLCRNKEAGAIFAAID